MTTLRLDDVTCRICHRPSQQTVLLSTNCHGSPDLDLRPPEMERSTLDSWLQLCPYCGFCARNLAKSDGDEAIVRSPAYRSALADARYPELARRFIARALLREALDPAEAAQWCLCAAWACDDAAVDELAVECRNRAAIGFERSKPFEDSEAGLTRGAVLVDVLRRAGRLEQAASECKPLLAHRSATGFLKQVLELQLRLISAGERGAHRLDEAGSVPLGAGNAPTL